MQVAAGAPAEARDSPAATALELELEPDALITRSSDVTCPDT
jgi:hypothetical protein